MGNRIMDAPRRAALRALAARLRLDSGMGVDFVRAADAGAIRSLFASSVIDGEPASGAKEESAPRLPPRTPRPRGEPAAEQPRMTSPPLSPRPSRDGTAGGFTLVPYVEPVPRPDRSAVLLPLQTQAMTCRKCGLCERRSNVVWGEGDLGAGVMFIGEGPGREEDEQGRPFVGRSGRVLTDIIEKGMRVERRDVYITNVVKCRPPGNRDPRPEETAACSTFLDRQIEAISPRVIVAVGGVAGCALLGLPPKSGGLRGCWHEYRGVPLRVIFHPSYLLRQRSGPNHRTQADRDTWTDIQLVLDKLRARS